MVSSEVEGSNSGFRYTASGGHTLYSVQCTMYPIHCTGYRFGREVVLKLFPQRISQCLHESVIKLFVEQPRLHLVC